MTHPTPDPLRAALAFYADDANWRQNGPLDPNSANFTGGPARAALAAAPQPAPAAADERAEIERIICDAFTCDLRGRGDEDGAFWQTAADALLARGLRLPEDGETLAWAVIEDGIISPNLIDSEKESVQRWAEAWKGSMVRVAIRVVEGCDDAA